MLPPDMMSALAGAANPEPGAPGSSAPAPAAPAAGPDQSDAPGSDNLQSLRDAIDAAQAYVDGEDDDIHKQTALTCIAKLQSILAEEQKGADDLLQGKPNPRALRRAASGPQV
jgi:hypothetical protein